MWSARARSGGGTVGPHFVGLALLLLLEGSGCALAEYAADDSYTLVHGTVQPTNWGGEPVVVVLSEDADPGERNEVQYQMLHDPGPFYFYVYPGRFELGAYEDRSGGLTYRQGDPVLLGDSSIVVPEGLGTLERDLVGPMSTTTRMPGRFEIALDSTQTQVAMGYHNLGRVVSFDAAEMSIDLGTAGVWDPARYEEEVMIGLFFTEPFSDDKIPVLFVHGIGGAPVQFETMAKHLDHELYQPWFFAYPSIYPLSMLAGLLNDAVDLLRRRHDFDQIHVVAHSMGGLVVRAYLNEYAWSRHDYRVRHFLSLASPFWGETGAAAYPGEDRGQPGPFASWLASVPESDEFVHLSWTDMAPDSTFLAHLYDEPLPEQAVYDLVFAYDPRPTLGVASDGTVSVESQLRPDAQREAAQQRGFAVTHDEVLVDSDVLDYVYDRLRSAGGDGVRSAGADGSRPARP